MSIGTHVIPLSANSNNIVRISLNRFNMTHFSFHLVSCGTIGDSPVRFCSWKEVSRSPGFHLVQVQAWLKSGQVGNLKIAYAMLINS